MSGVKAIGRDTISLQLKSLFVFEFLNTYNEFERIVRKVFEKNIGNLSVDMIHRLYFMYGGKLGTYIEYDDSTIKLISIQYKKEENFKELSINQIIRLFKVNACIEDFKFEIPSLQRSSTVYPFIDCALKLINMRNKLAHELMELEFRDKDLIELLILDHIKQENFEILQNFDIENMDNMTQYIASNIVYMRKMILRLQISLT